LASGKGTVYNHFESKDALFEAVLREACTLADGSAQNVPVDGSADLRLAAFVAGNLEWASAHPALARVFARELLAGDDETRALVLAAAADCLEVVESILVAGAQAGELRSDMAFDGLAVTFICHANLLLAQSWSTGWPTQSELPELAASLFLRGVRAD
jgi:AcrR family transcriptional regulator